MFGITVSLPNSYIASKPVFKLALSRTHAPVLQYAEYCDKSSNQFHWLHDYWGNALSIATLPNAFCRSMNVTNVEVFKAWLMPSNLFLGWNCKSSPLHIAVVITTDCRLLCNVVKLHV